MRTEETMSFLEHLEELRIALLRSVMALFMGMLICVPFTRHILDFLKQPIAQIGKNPDTFLIIPEVMGSFKVAVSLVFWSGLLLASPFVVFFIARFIFPGLHAHERRLILKAGWAVVLLFFGGAAMGYYGTTTFALDNLLRVLPGYLGMEIQQVFLTNYIAFMIKLIIGFGLAFELPLVLLIAGYAGLVGTPTLRRLRRHVVVGLLAMAMALTPPEPVSQIMMAGTLYLLYEFCILLLRAHEKRRGDL
jgi:sec-independent protein translocase protein TatC